MAVRKRGGIWYYDFMMRHARYREAIPEARTKAQAEQVETKVRLSIFEGKYCKLHQNEVPTLKQFIKETFLPWSKANKRSYQSDSWRSNVLIDWFDKKRLDEITPFLIEKFKKERREGKTRLGKERSPASVNREIELLSRILTMAVDNDLIETNPCRKVRKLRLDNRRIRYLSVEEEERLMAALTGRKAHLRPLVILAINTGMRRGELFSLTWEKVDFTRNVIYVSNTKSGKDRVVPMNQTVRDELIRMSEQADGEFVFVSKRTGLNLTETKKGFNAACQDAGIKNFRFHDLRHTAGTRLADAGADAFTIKEILGHSSIQTSAIYVHATDEGKRRAVEALASYSSQKSCLKFVSNQERRTR
ncbi:MAG: site-specific integrase [Acidobacteria bacterium]|nr:site-specific integrase [Acidobacteriota bacterium]